MLPSDGGEGRSSAGFLGPQIIARFIATPVRLHTQLQFFKKKKQKQMLPGQQDGKIPCVLQTSLYSRNVSSTLNCRQTLLLGPADWVIFIFLFRIMTSSLRNLLCLPPVHTSPTTSLLQICLHTFESHGRYHLGSKSLPAPPCYFSCCK